MELIITSLFLFNILNTNAIYVTNDIQNNTLMIEERKELSSERTSNYTFDERNRMQTAVSLDEQCVADEECRTPNSYCGFSLSFSKTCICKRDHIRVSDTCLKRKSVSLDNPCLTKEQCQTPNSICEYSSYLSYKSCKCKPDYIRINGNCSRKVSLDNPCLTNEQCQTPNSFCEYSSYLSYKSCKCKPDYIRINGNCSIKAFLDEPCLVDEQCKTEDTICKFGYFTTFKVCKCRLNYFNVYGRCLRKVRLGIICSLTEQCLTSNSYCATFCLCRVGYQEENGECVMKVYPSKHDDLDNGIIALFSIFAVIVTMIIIFTIISYFKKRAATQSRTHIPPAYTVQLPPNIDGSHTNAAILQSQAARSTIYDLDKPPSYEDVVRS